MAALDVVTINGFRCSSATRTILDLAAAGAMQRRLEAAIDTAVRLGGESELERRFLELMRRGGLPRPVTQAVQRRDGRHVARVDFLFANHGIVVEVTGRLGQACRSCRCIDRIALIELT